MKQVLRKYILTLLTLLLGGCGLVSASVKQKITDLHAADISQNKGFCVASETREQPALSYSIFKTFRDERITTEESEDNALKFSVSRKPGSSGSVITFFSNQRARLLLCAFQKQLPFYQFLINGSCRYLTFQVLRL